MSFVFFSRSILFHPKTSVLDLFSFFFRDLQQMFLVILSGPFSGFLAWSNGLTPHLKTVDPSPPRHLSWRCCQTLQFCIYLHLGKEMPEKVPHGAIHRDNGDLNRCLTGLKFSKGAASCSRCEPDCMVQTCI